MKTNTIKTKSDRSTYTILSGEGEIGTIRVVKCTLTGLKRILTAERCKGDRWAKGYEGEGQVCSLRQIA